MNKQNKVLLSTIGLLLLSGIAATSSTFAWFTTVRTASINYGSATVGTKEGNLGITYKSTLNSGLIQGGSDNALTLTGTNAITDISGDGKTFYKPVWASQVDAQDGVASVINTVASAAAGDADGKFIDFTYTVSRSNLIGDTGMKVYLGKDTTITLASGSSAVEAVEASRLAVLVGGNVVQRWAPVAETTPKYLAAGTGAYGTTTHKIEADANFKSGAITTYTTISTADAGGYLIATLASGTATSVDVTFRVWIEGEDAQTDNDILGGILNVEIDLYGLDIIA